MRISDWSSDVCSSDLVMTRHLKLAGESLEISLVFTDDAEQRSLNRDYRMKDRPTNVLSFPSMDDGMNDRGSAAAGQPRLLGDVVLARETIAREARAQGKSMAEIGRAHVCTPVTNAQLVCRLLLEKKKNNTHHEGRTRRVKITSTS